MLQEAYQDVKLKGIPIRRAARQHGLPESTLRWRLANDLSADVKRGGPTFFTRAQEEMLAEHRVSMAHLRYGFSRWQIIDMASNPASILRKSTLTGRWRPDIDLRRMLTGNMCAAIGKNNMSLLNTGFTDS